MYICMYVCSRELNSVDLDKAYIQGPKFKLQPPQKNVRTYVCIFFFVEGMYVYIENENAE